MTQEDQMAGKRLRIALEMAEFGIEMMRQNFRRAHPHASEAVIAAELAQWLRQRPGAEYGDSAGTPRPWPRKP